MLPLTSLSLACLQATNDGRSSYSSHGRAGVSVVAAVSCNRPSRRKTLAPAVVVRLLEKAHQRGRLTDGSFELLRDLIKGGPSKGHNILQDWMARTGAGADEDLDDLDESIELDSPVEEREKVVLESDVVWQQEACTRERQYKRGHLNSYGIPAGIDSRCPFEAPQQQHQPEPCRRELKALRSWRDLDMPGFVEKFLRKYEAVVGTSGKERETAVQTKCNAVLQDLRARHLMDPGPSVAVDDLMSRQIAYIVNSGDIPPPMISRRSECGQLYRRLARALDQRAPPDQRLFTHDDTDEGHTPDTNQVVPLWMRASVSRHMFGGGSDIFISVNETRLADYDPYQT